MASVAVRSSSATRTEVGATDGCSDAVSAPVGAANTYDVVPPSLSTCVAPFGSGGSAASAGVEPGVEEAEPDAEALLEATD